MNVFLMFIIFRFYKEKEEKNFDESLICERRLPWLALNEVNLILSLNNVFTVKCAAEKT